MTNQQPPTVMEVELEDGDVREDLSKIVNAMSKIRNETIKDRKLSDTQQDEYLHLSWRLASGVKAIADESTIKRMQIVADRLTKNPTLSGYDPMQDGHWRREEKEFTTALDDLLIATVRDDFHTVDAKHHILQAVKYLGSEDATPKERKEVYDTILPFQKAISPESKEGFFGKIFGRIFGNHYKVSSLEDLALNIDATSDGFTDELIQLAEDRGHTSVKVEVRESEFQRMKKDRETLYPEMKAVSRGEKKPNQTLVDIANGAVKYTKPLSYPILGALPESLQDRLSNTLTRYNADRAVLSSIITEVGGSIVGPLALAVSQRNGWYLLSALPLIADGIVRFFKSCPNDPFFEVENHVGSAFLKPFFFPLELYLNGKERKTITVEFPVRGIKTSPQVPNPIELYDSIGKMEVPEEVENNLEWSNENHHQFGKSFMAYVTEHSGTKPTGIELTTTVDKLNQAVVYSHELPVEEYTKNSSLFCFNGRRYLVTTIRPNNGKDNFIERASAILSEDSKTDESKLEKLGKELGARYVHLREYRNGQQTSDMEGFE